jgi:uncharacterized membrane protein YccF (DUF307 family)
MKLRNTRQRTKVLTLGAIVAAVVAAVAIFTIAGSDQTGVASNFRDVSVGQTIQHGDVSVTLEELQLGDHETRLTYQYNAPSGEQVEPIGLPVIRLPNGNQLEADSGGGYDGLMPVTRTFAFSPLPKVGSIMVDAGSFIQYAPAAVSVDIPVGDALEDSDGEGVVERKEIPLAVEFSLGDAQFRITKLQLDPGGFALVSEPVNDAASRIVLGGQSASITLTDDQHRQYDNFSAGAGWSPARGGGHVMSYQGLHFEGWPAPGVSFLTLHLDGVGNIRAPFVFQVDIPSEDTDN